MEVKETNNYWLHFARVNKLSENDEKSIYNWYKSNEKILQFELNKYLNGFENKSILELGCGIGNILKQNKFMNYVGVDDSSEQLKICRKFVTNNILQADILKFLRNTDKHFDMVIMFDLIEHIKKENIIELLNLIFKVLNSGGEILIRTPNMASFPGLNLRYDDFTHEIGFTKESLQQILEESNFYKINYSKSYMTKKKIFITNLFHWGIYKILFGYKPEITTPNIIVNACKV